MSIYPKSLVFVIFPPFVFVFVRYNKTDITSLWGTPSSDNPLEGELFLVETPHGCHICIMVDVLYYDSTSIIP